MRKKLVVACAVAVSAFGVSAQPALADKPFHQCNAGQGNGTEGQFHDCDPGNSGGNNNGGG